MRATLALNGLIFGEMFQRKSPVLKSTFRKTVICGCKQRPFDYAKNEFNPSQLFGVFRHLYKLVFQRETGELFTVLVNCL